jgi:hypothetical protein
VSFTHWQPAPCSSSALNFGSAFSVGGADDAEVGADGFGVACAEFHLGDEGKDACQRAGQAAVTPAGKAGAVKVGSTIGVLPPASTSSTASVVEGRSCARR